MACRSPPESSRWRVVRPELAWIGRRHRSCEGCFAWKRSMFWPAVMRSWLAPWVPTPKSWVVRGARRARAARAGDRGRGSRGRVRRAAGEAFERKLCGLRRAWRHCVSGRSFCRGCFRFHAAAMAEFAAELVGRGDDQVVELLQGCWRAFSALVLTPAAAGSLPRSRSSVWGQRSRCAQAARAAARRRSGRSAEPLPACRCGWLTSTTLMRQRVGATSPAA